MLTLVYFFVRKTMPSLLVAAIDFGTTFSGYAFSFLHEYKKDPLKISTMTWNPGSRGFVSLKTPTCVLFDPERNFHSFGYKAEEKYSNLAFDDKHLDWYFFRRFKMMLYNNMVCCIFNFHLYVNYMGFFSSHLLSQMLNQTRKMHTKSRI